MQSDELKHYGVLGMKWGVRRGIKKGDVSKPYSKASKKLVKLDSKVNKLERKANKKLYKAVKAETSMFNPSGKATAEREKLEKFKAK